MKLVGKSSSALVALLLSFLFIICGRQSEPIKFGAVLPLSGGSAVWGTNTKKGIDLAVEKINASGGINGRKVEILYEDTQGVPANGVTALQKLISLNRVHAVIDNSNSSVTLAMAPVVEQSKVVLFVTGASAPKIADAGQYVYRIWNSDALQASAICNYAIQQLDLKRVAILYVTNDYGLGLQDAFSKILQNAGRQIVLNEGFAAGTKDFRTLLTKVKTANSDGLFFVAYPDEAPALITQIRELKYVGVVMGNGDVMEDSATLQAAGSAANGIYYATNAPADSTNEVVSSFIKDYRSKYGTSPGITADVGYDAPLVLAKAISLGGGTTGEAIKSGLDKVNNFQGASGLITFDEKGEVNKPMAIKSIKDGASQLLSLAQ